MKNLLLFIFCFSSLLNFAQITPTEGILLSNWQDPSLPATSTSFANIYNDIWGYANDGREYAIIGSTLGVHFIDVTDPFNPVELVDAFVPGAAQGTSLIHRDYHEHNGYLYTVADEGLSTLQIIDLSPLPDSTTLVYDTDALLKRAHNIFIDEDNDRMYSAGSSTTGPYHNVGIYDISDPVNPSLLAYYNGSTMPLVNYAHDIYVKDHIAYLNCGNAGFFIFDFTDATNPIFLGSMTNYTQQGYNHSGWLNIDNPDYYYMADETHGRDLKVVNVADFSDITVDTTFNEESGRNNSIAHNLIYHCNKLYVSYYYDGLQVFDLSDPAAPQREYYYDTYSGADVNSYHGAWGVYPFLPSGIVLISDMQTGLYVIGNTVDSACIELDTVPVALNAPSLISPELTVSPMPFGNQFNLEINSPDFHQGLRFELFDLSGRSVELLGNFDLNKGSNNFSFQPKINPGAYFLKVSGPAFQVAHKMIKFE